MKSQTKRQQIFSSKEIHLLSLRYHREGERTISEVVSCTGYLQILRSPPKNGLLVWTVKNNGIKYPARKFRVLGRMVVDDGYLCEEVKNKNDYTWEYKFIYVAID